MWFDGALNDVAVWCADEGIVVLQRCSVAALQWCSKRYTNVLRDDEDDENVEQQQLIQVILREEILSPL